MGKHPEEQQRREGWMERKDVVVLFKMHIKSLMPPLVL